MQFKAVPQTFDFEELVDDDPSAESPTEPDLSPDRPPSTGGTVSEPADGGAPAPTAIATIVPDRERSEADETRDPPVRPAGAESALSIADLYSRLRLAVESAFPREEWIIGEIQKFTPARSGHRYLELADRFAGSRGHSERQTLEVSCWRTKWPRIEARLREAGVTLQPGLVVRIRGRVSLWDTGSRIRFTMTDVDVDALVGDIAAARNRLLRRLAEEGLLDRNAKLEVPVVPLRIGLVTSPGSEAYHDFTGRLLASGFAFDVRLEPARMQGREAASDVPTALRRLRRVDPDLVVLVRGGGARGDLAAFESEGVARAIASAPFPVWTGIGHTGDHSVADAVANRSLVTPTACAEAVVDRVATFWADVAKRAHHLATRTRLQLDAAGAQLRATSLRAGQALAHRLDRRSDSLSGAAAGARRGVMLAAERSRATLGARAATLGSVQRHLLDAEIGRVGSRQEVLRAYDPRRQLERGYATVRGENGAVVRRAGELRAGSRISTTFLDGSAAAVVESVELDLELGESNAIEQGEGGR